MVDTRGLQMYREREGIRLSPVTRQRQREEIVLREEHGSKEEERVILTRTQLEDSMEAVVQRALEKQHAVEPQPVDLVRKCNTHLLMCS